MLLGSLLFTCACSLSPDLPEQSPPLADLEEPLDLRAEPDDEAARIALPAGSFSGLVVEDARDTLAAKLDQPGQLRLARIVENSPAAAAGLQVDDLLLEATVEGGSSIALARVSEWRQLELTTAPGRKVVLVVDRAGREARTELQFVPRLQPAERNQSERYREEQRIGVVLRTATGVEARRAALGPGAGAVIVGLSQHSPWRSVGLRFGDLLVGINGKVLTHPQDLLTAVREATGEHLQVDYLRDGERATTRAPLSRRDSDLTEVSLPLLFSYEAQRGATEWSLLLGIFHYRSTAAAWRFRLLWLIGFAGGDADRLLEVAR